MAVHIEDGSNDRRYFTMVSNYILNHSTAIDQALYLQMKRIAGENGKCVATRDYFLQKLGIGKHAFQQALKYLVEHNWITFIGREGRTTHPINAYKLNDLWKLNVEYYAKKIGPKSDVSQKLYFPVNGG